MKEKKRHHGLAQNSRLGVRRGVSAASISV
jgi:hypothetical protein